MLFQAQEAAAAAGVYPMDVSAFFWAMLQLPESELIRLLKLQGIALEPLQRRVEAMLAADISGSERLKKNATLSQFNFWFSALEFLDTAWDVAQYDQGKIGEAHLVYALLLSQSAEKLLKEANANTGQMVEQVAWI